MKVLAKNRRATHDYAISDTEIAGLVLLGSEVKSIRAGRVSLAGSYCVFVGNELYLRGATIAPYATAAHNHDPTRDRKLLLTKKQLKKYRGYRQQGLHIVPLALVEKNGFLKVRIALGRSRTKHDKRAKMKRQDDQKRVSGVVDIEKSHK